MSLVPNLRPFASSHPVHRGAGAYGLAFGEARLPVAGSFLLLVSEQRSHDEGRLLPLCGLGCQYMRHTSQRFLPRRRVPGCNKPKTSDKCRHLCARGVPMHMDCRLARHGPHVPSALFKIIRMDLSANASLPPPRHGEPHQRRYTATPLRQLIGPDRAVKPGSSRSGEWISFQSRVLVDDHPGEKSWRLSSAPPLVLVESDKVSAM